VNMSYFYCIFYSQFSPLTAHDHDMLRMENGFVADCLRRERDLFQVKFNFNFDKMSIFELYLCDIDYYYSILIYL